MDCIPSNQTLIMKLTQDNKKKANSPPIADTFTISANGVYNHIIKSLKEGNYDESYNFLIQLKIMIRCVWKVMFNISQYPNIKYITNVSKTPITDKTFYGERLLKITPRTKEMDSETLSIIHRNLVPVFDYNIHTFSDSMWDKYLLIFDNILLSENVHYRKELKLNRDEQLKRLSEEDNDNYAELKRNIMKAYENEIESLKYNYIFKIVNYLNWLHYNHKNTDMAWAVILLRLYVLTKNKYHNEQYQHTEADFANYIRNYKYSNDKELLELYIAIIVYRYQFINKSIVSYDKHYIEQMIYYLTGHLKTMDEYIKDLQNNIIDNIQILRLLLPDDKMMEYIVKNCLNKFNYKTKELYNKLLIYYPKEILEKYGVEQRFQQLFSSSEICKLFNKLTAINYNDMIKELNKYDHAVILECFTSSYLIEYSLYSRQIIKYMLSIYDKNDLHIEIMKQFNSQQKYNKSVNQLYGLLMAVLDKTDYYKLSKDKITTLLEASNNNPTESMITFILSEANERLKTAKGYDKFQLETIINELN